MTEFVCAILSDGSEQDLAKTIPHVHAAFRRQGIETSTAQWECATRPEGKLPLPEYRYAITVTGTSPE